jgi:hypothetical protein
MSDTVYLGELKKLSKKDRELLVRCAGPKLEGCNDEFCTNPCYSRVGISFVAWRAFVHELRQRRDATILPGQPG